MGKVLWFFVGVGLGVPAFAGDDGAPPGPTVPVSGETIVPAISPTEGLDGSDPEPWIAKSRLLMQGPPGCREYRGEARLRLALAAPGGFFGPGEIEVHTVQGTFEGRMADGVWTARKAELRSAEEGDRGPIRMDTFVPFVGRMAGSENAKGGFNLSMSSEGRGDGWDLSAQGGQGLNLLEALVAAVEPTVVTAWLEADGSGRAVLLQETLVEGGPNDEFLRIRTTFDAEGAASRVDMTFPRKVNVEGGVLTMMDAQVHLRAVSGASGVLPSAENTSFVLAFLGFTLGIEQELRYQQSRPCTGESPGGGG